MVRMLRNAAYPVERVRKRVAFGKAVTEDIRSSRRWRLQRYLSTGEPLWNVQAVASVLSSMHQTNRFSWINRELAEIYTEESADVEAISIREFCELPTPTSMFDKNGVFVVMKLEQVSCLLLSRRGRGRRYANIGSSLAPIVLWTRSSTT